MKAIAHAVYTPYTYLYPVSAGKSFLPCAHPFINGSTYSRSALVRTHCCPSVTYKGVRTVVHALQRPRQAPVCVRVLINFSSLHSGFGARSSIYSLGFHWSVRKKWGAGPPRGIVSSTVSRARRTHSGSENYFYCRRGGQREKGKRPLTANNVILVAAVWISGLGHKINGVDQSGSQSEVDTRTRRSILSDENLVRKNVQQRLTADGSLVIFLVHAGARVVGVPNA